MEHILSQLLFIDIETVPQFPVFEQMPENWQRLFAEKMTKTMPESQSIEPIYNEKAGILAEFGKIICISLGYFFENENKEPTLKVKNIFGDNEADILNEFVLTVQKFKHKFKDFQFAGHNIREFDIPYISRRLLINQIPLPDFLPDAGAKPWEVKMFDTLQYWKFGDYKNYISLHLLANVLGVPTPKDDISGKDVQRVYYEENDLPRIAKYCAKDVAAVANVYLRLNQLPLLKEENVVVD
ncbi:3'-5' exonuclease [Arachidicoccus ginsenosidimutans]|uniref:ribonuclease H-like domain-containing protein n=1 Tax=Arachidicoccus sp. BS20 TaxID=1850526 RepID=UPI0007F06A1A|nr:ribonuclease H-like domain-containing protein [Arachidicoccus sp. BS20]ANI90760.1 3'-5' exonuclease [Arachidicoccus sp. BS20]